uniref:Uncharacterized protein n=1 Tax=Arundo donax TaxID=35708 RepID=A0A0A9F5G4_ARUDO
MSLVKSNKKYHIISHQNLDFSDCASGARSRLKQFSVSYFGI